MSGNERRTRDDLVQVEYDLYSVMLDDTMTKRREDATIVAAGYLGVKDRTKLVRVSEDVPQVDVEAVQVLLHEQVGSVDPDTLTGANPTAPVSWKTIEMGARRLRVPNYVSIPFPAGTVSEVPFMVSAWPHNSGTLHVEVYARPGDQEEAEAYLRGLISDARGERSPYRHQIVEAQWVQGSAGLRLVDLEPVDRESLVLAPSVWEAVVRNVDNMFERMDRLEAAGLGTNRGLLLAGPPGTGKSALCRALAHEYVGRATTTIVSASAGQYILGQVYERVNLLSPALVLIEDLDLLVGDREDRERVPLVQFLTVLDGLMTHHSRVVTVATTNDPDLVDAAAVRAARFDQVVELGLPDVEQRAAILRVYLKALDHDVDPEPLAAMCEGFSGADLREVVRSAVLDGDDSVVHTSDLLEAIERRRAVVNSGIGSGGRYL